jgi:hypothetical protein
LSVTHALRRTANDFAKSLTELLNGTVCDGARVSAYTWADGRVTVGTALNRMGRSNPVPLRAKGGVRPWLSVYARVFLDSDRHLAIHQSVYSLTCGATGGAEIFHYDFDRNKADYAEAHLQISGCNDALTDLLVDSGRPKAGLERLHLPVGGRRFRPSVEDIVEFLIDERLVEAKPDARDVLHRSRGRYHQIQLRAAVRSRPDIAADALPVSR